MWREWGPRLDRIREELAALEALDRQYGGTTPLRLEGADTLVASLVTELAHLEAEGSGRGLDRASDEVSSLLVGVALWARRHDVPLAVVEPVANALAYRSNAAASKEALAAVFGLMQGVIEHVRPVLAADLERSNPERPWRILHLNFAITAIRTEDPALIEHAFDALDAALPDERAGFYAEALALALAPRVAPAVREAIGKRHGKWTREA